MQYYCNQVGVVCKSSIFQLEQPSSRCGIVGWVGFALGSSLYSIYLKNTHLYTCRCCVYHHYKSSHLDIYTFTNQAVKIVRDIEDRLQGNYPKSKGLPLSIEGQVDDLIKESFAFLSPLYFSCSIKMYFSSCRQQPALTI